MARKPGMKPIEALFHVFTLVPERFGVGQRRRRDRREPCFFGEVCQVSVLSESMVIIIIGYLLGIILPTHGGSIIAWAIGDVGVEEEGLAMAGVLNLFLLPIIIFEAGWSMNHRAFVDLLLLGPSWTIWTRAKAAENQQELSLIVQYSV